MSKKARRAKVPVLVGVEAHEKHHITSDPSPTCNMYIFNSQIYQLCTSNYTFFGVGSYRFTLLVSIFFIIIFFRYFFISEFCFANFRTVCTIKWRENCESKSLDSMWGRARWVFMNLCDSIMDNRSFWPVGFAINIPMKSIFELFFLSFLRNVSFE